jgi:UDP-N-acetylglucosamine 3-dehydrogenase
MSEYRVGIIGCGRPHKTEGSTGYGQAHRHMLGYQASQEARLVAVADIVKENAHAFQEQYGAEKSYTDYREMLEKERLDVVSICTWPHLHAPMVCDAAEAGVRAIFCEKPMATTFGDAKRMVTTCETTGALLAFSHQRRFNHVFRKAKEVLKSGAIGELRRLEASCSNLFDWGTHWFDMLFFYNDETPVEWVIGQIDIRDTRPVFGAPCEGQGLSHFKYRNGVRGLMITGFEADLGASNRLIGTEGVIEVGVAGGPDLRVWSKGSAGWETVPVEGGLHGSEGFRLAVLDLIDALKTGREPELSGRRAFQATELIFATYESSRRRGRVDLPLEIEDSPLQEMLDQA